MAPFLFPHLEFALEQDLANDVGDGGGTEGGLKVGGFGDGAFGDVGEDVGDLEDFVDVFFAAGTGAGAGAGASATAIGNGNCAREFAWTIF